MENDHGMDNVGKTYEEVWDDDTIRAAGNDKLTCPFAWDLYNTEGDCLASK